MIMIKELVNNEINRIKIIVSDEKLLKETELEELKKSLDTERFKLINISYNIDLAVFTIIDTLFGESVKFEWKSFEMAFSLWKRRYDKLVELLNIKIETINKDLLKMTEFLSSMKDSVEINVSFGTNEIPVITHKFIKKFVFIDKLINRRYL